MAHSAAALYNRTEENTLSFFSFKGSPRCLNTGLWEMCFDIYIKIISQAFKGIHLNLRYCKAGPSQMASCCCSCHSPSSLVRDVRWLCLSRRLPVSREVIFPHVMTLPCIYLSCLSSHISSRTLLMFLWMLLSSFLHRLITPPMLYSDLSIHTFPPSLSLSLCSECMTERSPSTHSHWQLARGGGGGGREGWEEVEKGKVIDLHPSSVSLLTLSEEVLVMLLWSHLHHAGVWSRESSFWPRFASAHWHELGQKLSSAKSLVNFSFTLVKTAKVNINVQQTTKNSHFKTFLSSKCCFTEN